MAHSARTAYGSARVMEAAISRTRGGSQAYATTSWRSRRGRRLMLIPPGRSPRIAAFLLISYFNYRRHGGTGRAVADQEATRI